MSMRTTTFKLGSLGLLAVLFCFSDTASDVDYIYRDRMGNTLPPQKCSEKSEAGAKAMDPYNISKYSKRFCETQGYGWYVSEEKNNGNLVCNECDSDNGKGKYQCH